MPWLKITRNKITADNVNVKQRKGRNAIIFVLPDGQEITVKVEKPKNKEVKLAIGAPKSVRIVRGEIRYEGRESEQNTDQNLDFIMKAEDRHYRVKTTSAGVWLYGRLESKWVRLRLLEGAELWKAQQAAIPFMQKSEWELGVPFNGHWPTFDSPTWDDKNNDKNICDQNDSSSSNSTDKPDRDWLG